VVSRYAREQTDKKQTHSSQGLSKDARRTDQLSVVNLLPNQFVLTQRVACFTGYHVHWTFVHLLLNRSKQHKQRLTGAFLHTCTNTNNRLCLQCTNHDVYLLISIVEQNLVGINAVVLAIMLLPLRNTHEVPTVRKREVNHPENQKNMIGVSE